MISYPTSRDYDELIRLMQSGHELVCLVTFPDMGTSIAKTRYEAPKSEGQEPFYAVQSRGMGFAGGLHMTAAEFKKDCQQCRLEFVPPFDHLREALIPFYLFAKVFRSRDDILTPVIKHGHQSLIIGAFLQVLETMDKLEGNTACSACTHTFAHPAHDSCPGVPDLPFPRKGVFWAKGKLGWVPLQVSQTAGEWVALNPFTGTEHPIQFPNDEYWDGIQWGPEIKPPASSN